MLRVFQNDLFRYRSDALMRQALLKANGEDWYIKYVICDSIQHDFVLNFIEGDYCTVCMFCHDEVNISTDEYFGGVKKAIDYLSEKDETLYFIYLPRQEFPDPEIKLRPVTKLTKISDAERYRYNFDGFDYAGKSTPYIQLLFNIEPYDAFIDLGIRYRVFNMKQDIYNLVRRYRRRKVFPDKKDAKKIIKAIIKMDNYILSIPLPDNRIKRLPYSYAPRARYNTDSVYRQTQYLKIK